MKTWQNKSSSELIFHVPVLLQEVVENLLTDLEGIYVDATLGTGGHAEAISEKLKSPGFLVGLDRDAQILEIAKNRLAMFKEKISFHHTSFSKLKNTLEEMRIEKICGILFDLGLSNYHLESSRGFSYQKDSQLDMRFDQTQKTTAREVVNDLSAEELIRIFFEFGQEKYSRRIARAIVRAREKRFLTTTFQLREIIEKTIIKKNAHKTLSRIFQALRIYVNQELEELKQGLEQAIKVLKLQGKIAVISYHSLEDRITKHIFRHYSSFCICPPGLSICSCGRKAILKIDTHKALQPTEKEIHSNPQARSAKLRLATKIGEL